MYIKLRCIKCGESAPVSFETLLDIWKQGYDQLCNEHKSEVTVFAEVTCLCGHVSRCDSPMFKYTFQLIFDEFVLNTST